MLVAERRELFRGVEEADSLTVDPHKWLGFAPFDACALLYRDPRAARSAHAQDAEYLEVLDGTPGWNPRTTPFISPAVPADCLCGSRWPRTVPLHTAKPSRVVLPWPGDRGRDRREASSGPGARPRTLGGRLPARGLDRR
ncbi:pyridoxal-dependent decarboxylase [Streptomyces hawaiiensis]|uniref:pyridoxal-dependent decarboxylase n=1 Tax=Streptomyces hawaiiensis TaxID=67305 RepID=UPI001FE56A28|nr:pyridoxal-dependent decarboxylase [Streptomyces hawaiiensis]